MAYAFKKETQRVGGGLTQHGAKELVKLLGWDFERLSSSGQQVYNDLREWAGEKPLRIERTVISRDEEPEDIDVEPGEAAAYHERMRGMLRGNGCHFEFEGVSE